MKRLSDSIIFRAQSGDEEALDTIFKYYNAYFNTLAMETIIGGDGQVHYVVNEDVKSYIRIQVFEAIQKWRAVSNETNDIR